MRRQNTSIRGLVLRARIRKIISTIIVYSIVCIPLIPIVMMYGWLVVQAFSAKPVTWLIPKDVIGGLKNNWRFLFGPIMKGGTVLYEDFWRLFYNTLLLSLGTTGLVVSITSFAGYAISRFEFRGRDPLLKTVVILHSIPGVLFLIALMYLLNVLGLYGKGLWTLLTVTLLKGCLEAPMYTWMLKGFFDAVPWELEWAALVDGCGRFKAWRKVVLPLIFPGIAAVSIFAFLSGWGEYLLVYTYITRAEYYTLSVALSDLTFEFLYIDYGMLAAFSLFYMLPAVVFFIATQKYLMRLRVIAYKG